MSKTQIIINLDFFCIKRVFFLNMKLIMTIIYLLFNVKINNLKKKIHWSNEIN